MKRISEFILLAVLLISMCLPVFAAQDEKGFDITVKYVSIVEGEFRTAIENGIASAEGVTVTGEPSGAESFAVVPIPSNEYEAYEWFEQCLDGKGEPIAVYEISFLDADGNRISADGSTVSIECHDGENLTVYSLTTDGNCKELPTEIKNGSAVFIADDGDYFILTEKKTVKPKHEDAFTVPVRGDGHVIHADATVDGDTVELHELDFDEIDRIIGDKDKEGLIEIDLTELEDDIGRINLPINSIEHIVKEAEETHNEHESLQVDFSHGSVKFDDKTMRAIVGQSWQSDVILGFENVGMTRLNENQKAAVKDWNVYGGYEAYLFSEKDDKRISDFEGGVTTFSVPLEVPNGLDAEKFAVWYVSDNGETERQETWHEYNKLCWSVGHFSDFIIVYEGDETPYWPPNPPTVDDHFLITWVIVGIFALGIIFCFVLRTLGKKTN